MCAVRACVRVWCHWHWSSGFLGAGKSTLLQHILTNTEGLRVGVVVNDMERFSVTNIVPTDSEGGKGEAKKGAGGASAGASHGAATSSSTHVQMPNGCICCSLRSDLVRELVGLTKRAPLTHIVVEASGISEPGPVLEAIERELAALPPGPAPIALDTLVTVVDCERFLQDYRAMELVGQREAFLTVERADEHDRRGVVVRCACLVFGGGGGGPVVMRVNAPLCLPTHPVRLPVPSPCVPLGVGGGHCFFAMLFCAPGRAGCPSGDR